MLDDPILPSAEGLPTELPMSEEKEEERKMDSPNPEAESTPASETSVSTSLEIPATPPVEMQPDPIAPPLQEEEVSVPASSLEPSPPAPSSPDVSSTPLPTPIPSELSVKEVESSPPVPPVLKVETPDPERKKEVPPQASEIQAPAPVIPVINMEQEIESQVKKTVDEKVKALLAKANEKRKQNRETHLNTIVALAKERQITNYDVRELLHVSQSTASEYLSLLLRFGRLRSEGQPKGKSV